MKKERYQRLQAIFDEAVELTGEARRSFLEKACEGDPDLRRDVEQLLARDSETGDPSNGSMLDKMQDQIAGALGMEEAQPEAVYSPPLPEKIGHYRIFQKIGEGGMGTVYLAEQDDPRRRVALKVIRPDLFSPSLHKRFQFEVDVLGRLQHPGIAQILEAGKIETESGLLPYFAMEYVEGIELRRYAKQHDLGVRARLELAARICDAAHHAHLKGIVHRDLKPDNVLVVDTSSTTTTNGVREFARLGQPKVLDFGVARATDSDIQMTTVQTDIGKLVGTITYMSPEQVEGDSSLLDARSDIYALGVLLYELLSGRLPFDLRNKPVPEAARIIREEEPTRLGSIQTFFRGDIDTIVCKALEKDRERRYLSAAEMAADIRRYLANEPIAAHPPSTFYQLRKFARRNKGLVAGLAVAFVILVVGIISSLTFAVRATRGEQRALRSEESALKSETEARRAAYRLNLTAADAVGDTDPFRALNHLEAIPPEFRGWEWRHLQARFTPHFKEYRTDQQVMDFHDITKFYSYLRVTACRPDGTLLAVRMAKDGIELFNIETGGVLGKFGTGDDVIVPNLSTDGSLLAGLSRTEEKLIVWKTRPKILLFEMPLVSSNVHNVVFSPDSSLLMLSYRGDPQLIETATGRCVIRTAPYPTYSGQAAFSPDGTRFALHCTNWGDNRFGGDDVYLCIYTKSGDCLAHRLLRGGLWGMAFSPDGRHLAVGQTQRTIRLLDATTLQDVAVFHGHTDLVSALAFSESGKSLASGSRDGTVRIWNVAGKSSSRVFTCLNRGFGTTSITFTQDGKRLAAGNYQGIQLWDLSQEACTVLKGHASYIYRVMFSPDGSLIASGAWDDTVRLWDPLTGELLATLPGKNSQWKLGFTPDGTRVFGDTIWDPATGASLSEPRNKTDQALFNARHVVDWDQDYFKNCFCNFAGGTKFVKSGSGERVAVSWDRTLLSSGLDTGEIQIYDLTTGEIVKHIGKHDSPVVATAFKPDMTHIAAGYGDGAIKVWDLESGAELATLKGHTRTVYTVNYSPDGTRIASGSDDNNIILWDAETYEQVAVLRGHTSYVHSACFSPDGTMLASGSGDRTIRIWDSVPPAERREQIQHSGALRRQAAPLVDRLLAELNDHLDVADRLREDKTLSNDIRRAALRGLLERSVGENPPQD